METLLEMGLKGSARFGCVGESRIRRYRLVRVRGEAKNGMTMNFIMLNPSTAGGIKDDPTIRRCMGFAVEHDFRNLVVTNLFSIIGADPKCLLRDDANCEINDREIVYAAERADVVVAAWGAFPEYMKGRDREVCEMLKAIPLWCLGKTKAGYPRHPLYVSKKTELVRFEVG